MPDEQPLEFPDAGAWDAWLQDNYASSGSVWLKHAKKASPVKTVTYEEALQVALCHGWIDGQVRRLDDHFYIQRWSPRGPRSKWSKINTEHIERLTEERRMRPGGIAAVNAAKADGRWAQAYEPATRATPDPDFQQAIDASPRAKAFFDSLSASKRYSFIYRIAQLKKPETRKARIGQYVEMLANGQAFHD
jgi:uncharacterized protein YdeI (YjbR/CyaY-like superfamily)